MSDIGTTDSNIKSFERVARKYGVDFAVKKDCSASPPKYLVFLKSRDVGALTAAFREYTAKKVRRTSHDHPSVLEQFRTLKAKLLPSRRTSTGTGRKGWSYENRKHQKIVLPNLPYAFIAFYATKLGQAARLSPGADLLAKVLHIMEDGGGAYAEYRTARDKMSKLLFNKRNVDRMLGRDVREEEKTQEHDRHCRSCSKAFRRNAQPHIFVRL